MEYDWSRSYLIEKFQEWLYQQRSFYLPNARILSCGEKSRLSGYFEKRILDLTRVANADRIPNPEFYSDLAKSSVSIPLDFTQAVGLTLVDCVLIRKEIWFDASSLISTLFHEMIHVLQCDILGLRKLIELYTDSLIQNEAGNYSVVLEYILYPIINRF